MSEESLRARFPSLADSHFQITSPATGRYTCIGYAAGDAERVWKPDPWPEGLFYWPAGAPREDTLIGWTRAFETLDYRVCEPRDLEPGVEKVAIYVDSEGVPQHIARQLATWRTHPDEGRVHTESTEA